MAYSAVSTALRAYSSWRMRPYWVYVMQSWSN
jgi:hypothetical protein